MAEGIPLSLGREFSREAGEELEFSQAPCVASHCSIPGRNSSPHTVLISILGKGIAGSKALPFPHLGRAVTGQSPAPPLCQGCLTSPCGCENLGIFFFLGAKIY